MVRVRREVRNLTQQDFADFVTTVKQLQAGSAYEDLVRVFADHHQQTHGCPMFLPFNRRLLVAFEDQLQRVNPAITVPYWAWERDAQAPETSVILRPEYFGGNGRSSDHCVVDGAFADLQVQFPTPHCLQRDYDQGSRISPFPSAQALDAIRESSSTYDELRSRIEVAAGSVHQGLGGDMATTFAPGDPLFWVHAAFVDKQWAMWQNANPTHLLAYGGNNPDGQPALLTDQIPGFGEAVATVMETLVTPNCYRYV